MRFSRVVVVVVLYYGFQNAGQTCLSVERVYVEAPVYDDFVGRVVAKTRGLRVDAAAGGPGTCELGGLTLERQRDIVAEHVADAVAQGASVLTGGAPPPGPGTAFAPTVLTGVTHRMRCMREETFGPTLPIMAVADEDEAVARANDSEYGLGASVFTRDPARGERVARRLHAGSVAVNDAFVFYVAMELPMGGWKDSGVGVRHGREGLRKTCRQQAIVVGRRLPSRDPHMFPYRRARSRALVAALHAAARGGRWRSRVAADRSG